MTIYGVRIVTCFLIGKHLGKNIFSEGRGLVPGGLVGSDNLPDAHLQYLFFDEDFKFMPIRGDGYEYVQVSQQAEVTGANITTHLHEELVLERVFTKPGYIFIYVSNSSPGSNVYFDDLTVEHKLSPVEQVDDYYPFGLTFNSYTFGTPNLYKYQTKELQQEIAMYDFHARFYDPALGRTSTHDPHSDGYYNLSPYSWVGNNPIRTIDPDGKDLKDIIKGVKQYPRTFDNAGKEIVKGFGEAGSRTKSTVVDAVTAVGERLDATSDAFDKGGVGFAITTLLGIGGEDQDLREADVMEESVNVDEFIEGQVHGEAANTATGALQAAVEIAVMVVGDNNSDQNASDNQYIIATDEMSKVGVEVGDTLGVIPQPPKKN